MTGKDIAERPGTSPAPGEGTSRPNCGRTRPGMTCAACPEAQACPIVLDAPDDGAAPGEGEGEPAERKRPRTWAFGARAWATDARTRGCGPDGWGMGDAPGEPDAGVQCLVKRGSA